MNIIEWSVVIGGLTAIAWINWYFFLAPSVTGKQEQSRRHHNT